MIERSRGARYARFLAAAFGIVAVIAAIGSLPTRRLAGAGGMPAMLAGCAIGFIAACLAGVLLVAVDAATPTARMQRAFLAMTIRLAAAVVLGAAAVLSGEFSRQALLFWLAASYVVLLPLEVKLALASD